MDVSRKMLESPFVPFELKLVVETAEEARALYAIFNHGRNTRLFPLNNIDSHIPSKILNEIGDEHYHTIGGTIANGVTHDEFYGNLKIQ